MVCRVRNYGEKESQKTETKTQGILTMGCSGCGGGNRGVIIHQGTPKVGAIRSTVDYVLISHDRKPASGWKFYDPITTITFGPKATALELIEEVQAARTARSLDVIKNVMQAILNYMAELPENKFLFTQIDTSRKFSVYAHGAKHAGEIFGEKKWVDSYIATERARVCLNCPYNDDEMRINSADRIIDNRIAQMVGNRHTAYDKGLHRCRLCTCPLKTKVWFSKEVVWNTLEESVKAKLPRGVNIVGKDFQPVTCWMLPEGEGGKL